MALYADTAGVRVAGSDRHQNFAEIEECERVGHGGAGKNKPVRRAKRNIPNGVILSVEIRMAALVRAVRGIARKQLRRRMILSNNYKSYAHF